MALNASERNAALDQHTPPAWSTSRRYLVLVVVCLAMFVDGFNTGGVILCLNSIGADYRKDLNVVQWVLTAFNLTFGSFLLLSGHVSDIYHPKPIFITGFFIIGVFGIGAGFVQNIIGLIVIRAIQGFGSALAIPSAISILTSAFTDLVTRGVALTFFTAAGTFGLCLGLVLGGLIVEYASWRWVIWSIACAAVALSGLALLVIPADNLHQSKSKKLDLLGVSILTASVFLLVFALSEVPAVGWGTNEVITPLVISITFLYIFFWWQTRLEEERMIIPPKMWFIPNFTVLIAVAFSNSINFIGPLVLFSNHFSNTYYWSPFSVGLHVLPIGIAYGIVYLIFAREILSLPPKIVLVGGQAMACVFSLFYIYGDTKEKFWGYTFVAEMFVTIGSNAAYLVANFSLIASVPQDKAGVGAAVFNSASQIGIAINVAIITTITVEVQKTNAALLYKGVSAALVWVVAITGMAALLALVLFKPQDSHSNEIRGRRKEVAAAAASKASVSRGEEDCLDIRLHTLTPDIKGG